MGNEAGERVAMDATWSAAGAAVMSAASTTSESVVSHPVGTLSLGTDCRLQESAARALLNLVRGKDGSSIIVLVANARAKVQLVILLSASSDLATHLLSAAIDVNDMVVLAIKNVVAEMGSLALREASLAQRRLQRRLVTA
jgi:hypothetical protein